MYSCSCLTLNPYFYGLKSVTLTALTKLSPSGTWRRGLKVAWPDFPGVFVVPLRDNWKQRTRGDVSHGTHMCKSKSFHSQSGAKNASEESLT